MSEATSTPTREALFETMARTRAFEERVAFHFRHGAIHGFVHVSLGQEAVAAGVCAALRPDDVLTTTHRGHGHCIAKGADVTAMMAELFGRQTGICRGRGGSMHIADPRLGILGANGIVGAGIPLAVGAGLSAKLLDDGRVAVAFFGEGAVHCGAFHEGVTLAVAWSLPVLFVCENNGWAEFTASDRWRGPSLLERAVSYGLDAEAVDGCDAEAVWRAACPLIAGARTGRPGFLEARTVRMSGHYEGDPQSYRPESERASLAERDPLAVLRGRIDPDVAAKTLARAELEMDAAVDTALDAPLPAVQSVLADVYA